ncbi:cation transporter [Candidatus Micrarchaeota archaeon]|nr:cation transporter [Candidatus Micrarchaeota archaeon]
MGRNDEVVRVLLIVLALNWIVALAKILLGLSTGVLSIVADGLHSIFDGFSNVLGLAGMKYASKPADDDHPYGHYKFETLATFGIVALLVLTVYELGESIVKRIQAPQIPDVSFIAFVVMVGTLAVNFLVQCYESRKGRELRSSILSADALHTKSDIFVTLAVIAGMAGMRAGYSILDPIVTLVVMLFIIRAAFHVLKPSLKTLTDAKAVDEKKISEISAKVAGVKNIHAVRSRGDENCAFIDLHLRVDKNMEVEKAHAVSHELKKRIMKELPHVKDVVIHIEPAK